MNVEAFYYVFTDNLNVICSYINFICYVNKTYISILAVITTIIYIYIIMVIGKNISTVF